MSAEPDGALDGAARDCDGEAPRPHKPCTKCLKVLDSERDFYVLTTNYNTGHSVRFARCKRCHGAEQRLREKVRAPLPQRKVLDALFPSRYPLAEVRELRPEVMNESLEPLARVVLIERPHEARGETHYLPSHRSVKVTLRITHGPDYDIPARVVVPAWPAYGTTPICPRGRHAWPIEVPCRGYVALDCEGTGPHVHKRCVVHSCEEIEAVAEGKA